MRAHRSSVSRCCASLYEVVLCLAQSSRTRVFRVRLRCVLISDCVLLVRFILENGKRVRHLGSPCKSKESLRWTLPCGVLESCRNLWYESRDQIQTDTLLAGLECSHQGLRRYLADGVCSGWVLGFSWSLVGLWSGDRTRAVWF